MFSNASKSRKEGSRVWNLKTYCPLWPLSSSVNTSLSLETVACGNDLQSRPLAACFRALRFELSRSVEFSSFTLACIPELLTKSFGALIVYQISTGPIRVWQYLISLKTVLLMSVENIIITAQCLKAPHPYLGTYLAMRPLNIVTGSGPSSGACRNAEGKLQALAIYIYVEMACDVCLCLSVSSSVAEVARLFTQHLLYRSF